MAAIFGCGGAWAGEPETHARAMPELEGLKRAPELDSFDVLLRAMDAFAQALTASCSPMLAAEPTFLRELARAFPEGELAPRFAEQLGECRARLQESLLQANAARQLVAEASTRGRLVREAVAARAAAWAPKVESDARADVLSKRFGRRFSLEEKKERLQAKYRADEEFRRLSEEAASSLTSYLDDKLDLAVGFLAQVCHFHAALFGGAQTLARSFEELRAQLPAMKEAMAPPRPAAAEEPAASPAGEPLDAEADLEAEAAAAFAARAPKAEAGAEVPTPLAAAAADPVGRASSASPPSPPLEALAEAGVQRAGTVALASSRGGDTAIPEQTRPTLAAVAEPPRFAVGEQVQVWSQSENGWQDGLVARIFEVEDVDDGYKVPAGAVKVTFAKGTKYVRPDRFEAQLRKRAAAGGA